MGERVGPSYKVCVLELAKLYDLDTVGQRDRAKEKYRRFVQCLEAEDSQALGDNEIEALIKLSEMELEDGQWDDAVRHCQRILRFGAKGKETAERILAQIRTNGKDKGIGGMKYSQSGLRNHNDSSMDQEEDDEDEDDMEISYIN